MIATFLTTINLNFILKLNKIILSPIAYNHNFSQNSFGINAGICSDYGFNAFCILIFSVIALSRTFNDEKIKIKNLIFLISGIVALILTAKRGHILCFGFGAFVCYFFSLKKLEKKKKIAMFFGTILICTVTLILIIQIPATQVFMTRMINTTTIENALNGREKIYNRSLETIEEHLLFGVGIRGIYIKYGADGHNIYLQLLAELGILGAPIIFAAFIYCLKNCMTFYNKENDTEKRYILMTSLFGQLFFLINGITENTFYVEFILILYLILISFYGEGELDNCGKNYSNNTDI